MDFSYSVYLENTSILISTYLKETGLSTTVSLGLKKGGEGGGGKCKLGKEGGAGGNVRVLKTLNPEDVSN